MSSEDVRIESLTPDDDRDSIYFSTIRSRHADHFFADMHTHNQNQKQKKGGVRYLPYEEINPNPKGTYPSLVLNKLSFSKDLRSSSDKALLRLPVLKQEFHNISLELSSSDVMALMYTKESEMISLLRVLCGLKEAKGKLSGDILINGHRMSRDRLEKTVAFISAEPPTSTLTVRQYLKIHASFHPPMSERYGGVLHLINKLMSDLGLMPVCDILCDRLNRSQWQRVKVAAQLARDPSILICSDVLKEVDVHDQCFLIDYLREWAVKTSRIVIMAVSPMSLQVLRMFSKTLILASGRVVFYGPPNTMQTYFESIGCPCPPYKNMCDYYVDLVTHDNLTSDASRESSVRIARLVNKWNQSAPPIRRTASGKFLLDLPAAGFIMKPVTLLSLFWFEFSNNRVCRILTWFLIFSISTCLSLFLSDLTLTLPEAFLDRNTFMDLFCLYFPLFIGILNLKKSRHGLKEIVKMNMFRKNCSNALFICSSLISEFFSVLITAFCASIPIALFTDFHRKSPDYLAAITSLSSIMILNLFIVQLLVNTLCNLSSEPLSYFFFVTSWTSLYLSTGFPLPAPPLLKFFSPLQLPTFSVFRILYEESSSTMLPSITANLTNPVQLYSCGRTFLNTSQVTKGPCQRVSAFDLLSYYGYLRKQSPNFLFGYFSFSIALLFLSFVLLYCNRSKLVKKFAK